MLRLDFSASDLNLAENREKTRRASISGVQDKVQLKRVRGGSTGAARSASSRRTSASWRDGHPRRTAKTTNTMRAMRSWPD